MAKTVIIDETVENIISTACVNELRYFIYQSRCAYQYDTEIKALISFLRQVGHETAADNFWYAYQDRKEDK